MRHLKFLPFLAVLMGSDCDGGSEEPVDTAPPEDTAPLDCVSVLTPAECSPLEGGYYCDLSTDPCFAGWTFGDIDNTGATTVELAPTATATLPFVTLAPGDTSSAYSGEAMQRLGVTPDGASFELTLTWQ